MDYVITIMDMYHLILIYRSARFTTYPPVPYRRPTCTLPHTTCTLPETHLYFTTYHLYLTRDLPVLYHIPPVPYQRPTCTLLHTTCTLSEIHMYK